MLKGRIINVNSLEELFSILENNVGDINKPEPTLNELPKLETLMRNEERSGIIKNSFNVNKELHEGNKCDACPNSNICPIANTSDTISNEEISAMSILAKNIPLILELEILKESMEIIINLIEQGNEIISSMELSGILNGMNFEDFNTLNDIKSKVENLKGELFNKNKTKKEIEAKLSI